MNNSSVLESLDKIKAMEVTNANLVRDVEDLCLELASLKHTLACREEEDDFSIALVENEIIKYNIQVRKKIQNKLLLAKAV